MIWLLTRLIVWPVKVLIGTAAFGAKTTARTAAGSAKLGYRTGRLFGYHNLVTLALGVAVGLALAPRPGRDTRELVRRRLVDLGLLSGGAAPAGGAAAFAPVETPSPAPDVAAVGNGQGVDPTPSVTGPDAVADPPLMEGVEGPGPAPASEPRFPNDPGTNE